VDTKALHQITYGLYVVASRREDALNAQIANTVFQITSEPPAIAVGINRANLTHEFIVASGLFVASVLPQDTPLAVIGHFGFRSGRKSEKFQGTDYRLSPAGVPYLPASLAYLEAKVTRALEAGTHTVFVGEVSQMELVQPGVPLTYAHYHQMKRGAVPKAAPLPPAPVEQAKPGRWVCKQCTYIYDPEKGDPEGGVPAGTPFTALPGNWVCPVCGASKDAFAPED